MIQKGCLSLLTVLMASCAFADCLDELMPRPQIVDRRADFCPKMPTGSMYGGYTLRIKNGKPKISATTSEGKHNAEVTLWQLKKLSGGKKLPDCTIVDWSRFKYRGLLLDCGRNYQTIDSLKDVINHISKYKYNVFHWHIVDNYGWRLESKKYPQLQSAKAFSRDVGKFYTQAEFKELVQYAKKRGVTIIPELDMPGHTLAFRKGMGFDTLATEEAKIVLGELIDELCSLVAKEDMPIIHLGTDEAREKGEKVPQSHLDYWASKVKANGRELMGWSPGLRLPGQNIKHLWMGAVDPRGDKCAYIDSQRSYYINHVDAEELLPIACYQKPCRWGSDEEQLGAFVCCWHDDRIGDNEDMVRMSSVYPAVVLLSDALWQGREKDRIEYIARLPFPNEPEFALAEDLERRTLAQRDKVLTDLKHPFTYVAQTKMRWKMTDGEGKLIAKDIAHATIYPKHFWFDSGYVKANQGKVVLETWITSPKDMDCGAWIGMTGFSRSDGRSRDAPTPKLGQWNKHGATIELNGKAIDPPTWAHPGVGGNPKEQPLVDEDYWYRAPTKIHLKKGVNHVKMTLPKQGGWKWIGTFIPMQGESDHPHEVDALTYSSEEP